MLFQINKFTTGFALLVLMATLLTITITLSNILEDLPEKEKQGIKYRLLSIVYVVCGISCAVVVYYACVSFINFFS